MRVKQVALIRDFDSGEVQASLILVVEGREPFAIPIDPGAGIALFSGEETLPDSPSTEVGGVPVSENMPEADVVETFESDTFLMEPPRGKVRVP